MLSNLSVSQINLLTCPLIVSPTAKALPIKANRAGFAICPEVNEFRNVNTKRLKNAFSKQELLDFLFNLMRCLNPKNKVRKKNEKPKIPISHRTSSRILCG
jgi:hypothetical protein